MSATVLQTFNPFSFLSHNHNYSFVSIVNHFSCAHYTRKRKKTQHRTEQNEKLMTTTKTKICEFFFVNFAISSGTQTYTKTHTRLEAYTSLGIGFFLWGKKKQLVAREFLTLAICDFNAKYWTSPATEELAPDPEQFTLAFDKRSCLCIFFLSFRLFEKF